jgi:general secretion pathway protein F
VRYALTIRFCRTVSSLLSSGLSLPNTLVLTRDVIGNEEARQVIERLGTALRDGADFTEPLAQSRVFPPLVASLFRMGAESGAMPDVAARLATMYETKLEVGLQRLMSILEPSIIVFVGGLVAFIVLSIMTAIIGIYDLSGV